MRAWQARMLGPGGYNRASITNDALRQNLFGLDQYGEIKLETNLEYRFRMITKFLGATLKSALFVDCGNVWRLRPSADNPNGEIALNQFFQQLAVGMGMGVRYDAKYFIFRLDVGFKVKDPQFMGGDQWVIKDFFKQGPFKANFARTNDTDIYRFVQWNFGVGMPF